MDFPTLASKILELVGGQGNVTSLTHCATRLRFNLKDDSQADTAALNALEGVVSVINQGGQYQVVIGPKVKEVYVQVDKLLDKTGMAEETGDIKDDKSPIAKVLDTIAGMFVPIVPVMAGAGMVKALASLAVMFGWLNRESTDYQFITIIGDTVFYFLPVLLASSAAKKFKVNPYIAMTIGAMLISPTFVNLVATARETGTGLTMFSLPVTLASYSSSVIPIILSIWLMSFVEPLVDKYMPSVIRIFGTPMLVLIIVAPITFTVLGPLGSWASNGLTTLVTFLNTHVSWLVPTLVGATTPLLVMTGMHYGIIPIGINLLSTTGIDTVAGPGMMVSNLAQGGAALAVSLKSKKASTKSLAISTGISAVLGITEPALYGINLKFKNPLYAAMLGGGVAGFYYGVMNVGRFAQVPPGLLALPSYFSDQAPQVIVHAAIGCAIAFAVAFVAEFFLGIDED